MTCVDTVQTPALDAAELEMVANGRGSRMIHLLVGCRRMSVRDMARELDCTERHVYRLRDAAMLARVPVTIDDGWVVYWLDGRDY